MDRSDWINSRCCACDGRIGPLCVSQCIYIAPMKSLAAEMVGSFTKRLTEAFGIQVRELTGDSNLTKEQFHNTQVQIVTHFRWQYLYVNLDCYCIPKRLMYPLLGLGMHPREMGCDYPQKSTRIHFFCWCYYFWWDSFASRRSRACPGKYHRQNTSSGTKYVFVCAYFGSWLCFAFLWCVDR